MDRLRNVVIGIDFSSFSQVALAQAKRMARWNQTDLHLIHVVDKQVVSDLRRALAQPLAQVTEHVHKTTQERIQQLFSADPLERRHEPPGAKSGDFAERRVRDERRIELMVDIVVGSPYQEIVERIEDVNADLLMLGSNGASDPRQGIGDLATKCVRKAPCRVMIVREAHAKPFTGVVACVNFAEESSQVVQQAIRVAQQDNAKLHVVHMFAPPWDVLHYRSPTAASSPDFQKQYRENLYAELQQYLRDNADDIASVQVECQLTECQQPAEGIIEYVEKTAADLVVVGTRRRAKTILLGTQAERIVQQTPVSVLVIKP